VKGCKTSKLTLTLTLKQGGLAQLARAPALQAGGHRFDSDILHGAKFEVQSLKFEVQRFNK
jgi:hypothetical protein